MKSKQPREMLYKEGRKLTYSTAAGTLVTHLPARLTNLPPMSRIEPLKDEQTEKVRPTVYS